MTPQKTFVDWLRFRTKTNYLDVFESLKDCFTAGHDCLLLGDSELGRDGWTFKRSLSFADERIGWIDYGGESQREWVRVDIFGDGCKWINDWHRVASFVDQLQEAELRRVDLALDTFDGSVTYDGVVSQWESGGFDRGGRRPGDKRVISSDRTEGWTFYVGRRASSRFIRVYCKGWEILAKSKAKRLPFATKEDTKFRWHDLDDSTWSTADQYVRIEAEFKPADGYVIPWTILTNQRDSLFAGLGDFPASKVQSAPLRLHAMPSAFLPKLSMHAVIQHAKISYGKGLLTYLMHLGLTDENKLKVMNELISEQPSDRLVSLGILSIPE